MPLIVPSLLASDLLNLYQQVSEIEKLGLTQVHIDVMDGHFVPNLTFGPGLVAQLRKAFPKLCLDVHLMVSKPEGWIDPFIQSGASQISFHWEAEQHHHRILQKIQKHSIKAGVALNPLTPVSSLEDALPHLDFVLLMSVNPGFGGQKYLPFVEQKVAKLNEQRIQSSLGFKISIDGGIDRNNVAQLALLGVDSFVVGNSFFQPGSLKQQHDILRGACHGTSSLS